MITFSQAEALYAKTRNKEQGKPLCNNTRLVKRNGFYAVKLHNTDVVKIFPKDVYVLNSGGWRTVTTKDRINQFSSVRLTTNNGVWSFDGYVFEDGVKVNAAGQPIGRVTTLDSIGAKKKALDKEVNAYIKRFIEHLKVNGLKDPSPGDCWLCGLLAQGGDVSHLISHMEEDYFVPRLLYEALAERVVGKLKVPDDKAKQAVALRWHLMKSGVSHETREVSLTLRSYFTRRKPALLKEFDVKAFKKNRKERTKKD